jgi:hypothetical protein
MHDFHGTVRVLLHAANLRHGTDSFTCPPKGGVLRIFSPLKIRRLRPVLNPRTWVLKASTLPLDHRSRWFLLRMRYVSDRSCRENQNTHFLLFSENLCRLYENVEISGGPKQATDDNTKGNFNLIEDSIIWGNKMEISNWIFINYS